MTPGGSAGRLVMTFASCAGGRGSSPVGPGGQDCDEAGCGHAPMRSGPGPAGDDPRPPEEEEKVMSSLPADPPGVIVGVDTHQDVHVAVALDALGRRLGELQIAATTSGYGQLVRWVRELDPAARFGVEGTGSYGAGLHRYLRRHGLAVVEVNRPDRSTRHRRGKSDPIDAEAAARAVLAGTATGIPKAGDDQVEMVRLLKLTRDSAVKSRTQAINQIKGVLVTAPAELREALTGLSGTAQLDRCAALRPGPVTTPTAAAKQALRSLAHRAIALAAAVGVVTGPGRSAAQRSSWAVPDSPVSASRSSAGAVTSTPLIWLIAWVRDLTAESRVSFSSRTISTWSSPAFGIPVAVPASTARAAASASIGSLLPRRCRVERSGRFTSTTARPWRRR